MTYLLQDAAGCAETRRYALWFAGRLDAMWLLRKAHNERGMTTMTTPDIAEARLAAELLAGMQLPAGFNQLALKRGAEQLDALADELERLRAQVAPAGYPRITTEELVERIGEAHDASLDDDHTGARQILSVLIKHLNDFTTSPAAPAQRAHQRTVNES